MLGTNFRDYAIVLTQLELQDEAFSTVELYSECGRGRGGLPAGLGLCPPRVPALKEPSGLAAALLLTHPCMKSPPGPRAFLPCRPLPALVLRGRRDPAWREGRGGSCTW